MLSYRRYRRLVRNGRVIRLILFFLLLKVDMFVELWFEFPQLTAAEEQGLDEPAQEEKGQVQVDEVIVKKTDEKWAQIEYA